MVEDSIPEKKINLTMSGGFRGSNGGMLRLGLVDPNESGDMRWVSDWGPPTHMQVRSGDPRFQFDARVRRVNVRFVRTFFDGETIHTMDDEVVRTVIVP
jgi:hypothetical protein